jgi:hypothetical protein
MPAKPKAKPVGELPLYQLKITLKWSKPAIWRRLLVPANLRLDRLHEVIQVAMPWDDSHLHQFVVGKEYFGVPDPDGPDVQKESQHTLAELAPAVKSKFVYEYDFGDSWTHEIVVEKILPPDPGFTQALCLAGKNACPPDDCGGISGYYEMVAGLADPEHEEHESYKEWLGDEWDATAFDCAAINAGLKRLKI